MKNLITLTINKENQDYIKNLLKTKYKGLTYRGYEVYVDDAYHNCCGHVDVIPMFAYWDNRQMYKNNVQVISYKSISFDPVSLTVTARS